MTAPPRRPDPGRRPPGPRALVVCLVGALLVGTAGCGDDVTAGPAVSSDAATPSPGAAPLASSLVGGSVSPTAPSTTRPAPSAGGPSPSATGDAPVSGPEDTSSPAAVSGPAEPDEEDLDHPDGAGTGTSQEEASGGPLSVVAVRSARHDGFDRVVLELAGEQAGEPGWFARYVDSPTQEGSGAPLDVEGGAFLQLSVRGTGYPFDTGQEEVVGTVPGQGTELVSEVLVGGVLEGQAQVVVGLAQEVPYVVTRLQDPPRVVLDLVG